MAAQTSPSLWLRGRDHPLVFGGSQGGSDSALTWARSEREEYGGPRTNGRTVGLVCRSVVEGDIMETPQKTQYDLFLSHNHADQVWVSHLAKKIEDRGLKVFFGPWDIKPGANFMESYERAHEQSRFVGLVLSAVHTSVMS